MAAKRRKRGRFLRCLFTLGIGVMVYTSKIEPKLLWTKKVEIKSEHVSQDLKGLKIVQFSDTQIGSFYTVEDLKRAVAHINNEEADILVFTGDLIDEFKHYTGSEEEIIEVLVQLKAKVGKYAIYGNHDRGGGAENIYEDVMTQSGFKVLVNEILPLKIGETTLNIIGIDDVLLGVPIITNTLKKIEKNAFNLLLIHEPDAAEISKKFPVDLQLSGHSHGGQIRFPFIGTLITPPGAETYTHGLYTFQNNKRMHLYVNTGLGNTKLPFRFMNIPEITVLTLVPKA